ncbi:hypothetical protein [Nocardia inohanensis]|uniref:hypothetical protein n=1 Tax=Nocardia inohanensis TaxID=209246 RepID=UPI0012F8AC13|nr:hypothetical protein [Nocardia inohanensis]
MSEIERLSSVSRVPHADIAALGDLDEGEYATLRAAYEHALQLRERELSVAIDKGLGIIPKLLRPAARRILFS